MLKKIFLVLVLSVTFLGSGWAVAASADASAKSASKNSQATKVSLNQASEDNLKFLPGIGPTIAHRIVQYRQKHGDFKSLKDLAQVKGVGSNTVQQISDFVEVNG